MQVKKLIKNSFSNSAGWAISSVIAFITTPYFVIKLGIEGFGIYSLFTGFIGYYGLLDLGLGQAVIKFIANYKAVEDNKKINVSINSALWVQILIGLTGSFVLVLGVDYLIAFLNIPEVYIFQTKLGFYAGSVGFLFTMLSGTLRSVLMGLQRYDLTSLVGIVSNVILNSSIALILFMGFGLIEAILINVIVAVIICIVYLILIFKLLPNYRLLKNYDYQHLKMLLSFSVHMFVFKITSVFNNQLLRFIISAIVGPYAVTFYVVPMKIISAISGIIGNLSTVLFPYASELTALSRQEELKKLLLKSARYLSAFAIPIYLFVAMFSHELLSIWMGKEFANDSNIILSLLAVSYLISSHTMVPANIVLGLGKSKVIAFFSILVLSLELIITAPLTYYWGIIGTAVGVLITQIETPVFIYYTSKKYFRINSNEYINKVLAYHLYGIFMYFFTIILLRNIFDIKSLIVILPIGILLTMLYYLLIVFTKWVDLKLIKSSLAN